MVPDLPFDLVRLDTVGSTNDEARARIPATGAAGPFAVTAREQTAGRGRRGRTWVSPPGNLHLSIAVQPGRTPAESPQLGFVASLAVAEALEGLLPGVAFRCKWPNDVMGVAPDGVFKVAGMLLEGAPDGWVVLGIGIDVAQAPPPGETLHAARPLAAFGWNGGTEPVLAAVAERIWAWFGLWRAQGFAAVSPPWLARAHGLGEALVVRLEQETLTGRFAALDPDGALVLDQGEGGVRRIHAGDVFRRGP